MPAPPSSSGIQSPYVSRVSVNVLCPSHFDTCMKWVPAINCIVANVWRRSWSRTPRVALVAPFAGALAGRPTATNAGRKIVS